MGRLNRDQRQFLYSCPKEVLLPVRGIAAILDLSWVHSELAPFYSKIGRPSIDPELMIRMLVLGYVFAICSERVSRCPGELRLSLVLRSLDRGQGAGPFGIFARPPRTVPRERLAPSGSRGVVEACIAAGSVTGEGFGHATTAIARPPTEDGLLPKCTLQLDPDSNPSYAPRVQL
jgi:hypothetical protein